MPEQFWGVDTFCSVPVSPRAVQALALPRKEGFVTSENKSDCPCRNRAKNRANNSKYKLGYYVRIVGMFVDKYRERQNRDTAPDKKPYPVNY